MAREGSMSTITMVKRVDEYLVQRRRLGYALKIEGAELLRFARFADDLGHQGHLTTALALAWATSSKTASRLSWARRLEIVRCFAKYRRVLEPTTEVPPTGLLGPAHRRIAPHIYTRRDVARLLAAAARLSPAHGLRPATFHSLFGLLTATGLRINEALHLARHDVDLQQALLIIRETKFHKSRLVPLHPTVVAALKDYSARREHYVPYPVHDAFFLLDDGRALDYEHAHYTFGRLRRALGWQRDPNGRYPRLYDFRHTFVCQRLLTWYAQGEDIDQKIASLSTYLGHVKVTDTYWYVTGIPELMAIAAKRFETFAQQERPS